MAVMVDGMVLAHRGGDELRVRQRTHAILPHPIERNPTSGPGHRHRSGGTIRTGEIQYVIEVPRQCLLPRSPAAPWSEDYPGVDVRNRREQRGHAGVDGKGNVRL